MPIKQELEQSEDWLAEKENVDDIKTEEFSEEFIENYFSVAEPELKKEERLQVSFLFFTVN